MENKLTTKESNNKDEWDNFIKNSLNKNIYSMSDYIDVEKNITKLFCYKKNEIVASFVLKKSSNGKDIIKTDYLLYTPIIFRKHINSSSSKINLERFEVINFFCNYLIKNFDSFDITFDIYTKDIRPFNWIEFSYPEKKLLTNVLYTSTVDLNKIDDNNFFNTSLFKNFSSTMRQQLRYSFEKSK